MYKGSGLDLGEKSKVVFESHLTTFEVNNIIGEQQRQQSELAKA